MNEQSINEQSINEQIFEPLIKAFLGQMSSAMKVSDILAKHDNSEEITVDHLITGLVYRLMVPMTNEEVTSALDSAEQILDKLDETGSEGEGEESEEELDKKIEFGSRKVRHPVCNCSICMKGRLCLLNYHNHDCSDPLSDKFKSAIESSCEKHKIYI